MAPGMHAQPGKAVLQQVQVPVKADPRAGQEAMRQASTDMQVASRMLAAAKDAKSRDYWSAKQKEALSRYYSVNQQIKDGTFGVVRQVQVQRPEALQKKAQVPGMSKQRPKAKEDTLLKR